MKGDQKNQKDQMVKVSFEPAGWRTIGGGMAEKSIRQAYHDAVLGAILFIDENDKDAGKVIHTEDEGFNVVHVELSEKLVEKLAAQPFVGREYPDQTKSTLRVQPV